MVALAAALLVLALTAASTAPWAAAQQASRTVRVFAVSYHQQLDRIETYDAFRETITRRFEDEVSPHLRGDGLDLVTYPENTSLMGYLVGARGAAARTALQAAGGGANSGAGALASLAGPYAPQMAYYEQRFPGIDSPGQLLQLALTDTLGRLVVETFSDLAARHGVWVAVSSNLAPFEVATGPEAALLADPEADTSYAYLATEPDVRNRNLVFSPDGELVAAQDKAYLVPIERERGLGLGLYGIEVTDLPVADLPIGRLATVISKDAWMPDVNERLDQLRAQVVVQSEAFSTWGDAGDDLWPPDKFQRGGWWMVQKQPSFVVNATPQLVGNLGDLTFDGQPIVAVPGPDGDRTLCLSGQPTDVGWAAVGPWVAGDAASLCDPARRPALAAAAMARAPGSGSPEENAYVESTVFADVELPQDPPPSAALAPRTAASTPMPGDGVQVHAAIAVAADGAAHVAWIEDTGDATVVRGAALVDGSARAVPTTSSGAARYDHFDNEWDPTVLADDAGAVVIHTAFPTENWDLFAALPNGDRVRVDDADTDPGVVRERGHSDPAGVVLEDGSLVVAWSDLRWPWVKPQVRVATSTDGGSSWSPSVRVDGGPEATDVNQLDARDPGESRGQAFPAIASSGDGLVVVWQEPDLAGWPTVWLARSADRGASWSSPVRASPDGVDARRPSVAAAPGGIVVGWEEPEVGGGRVVVAPVRGTAVGSGDRLAVGGHGQRHLRLVPMVDGVVAAVFEDRRAGDADVLVSWLDGGTLELLGTQRVDDGPVGADAFVPVAAATPTGEVAVAWQDTRAGREHVRVATIAPPGGPLPRPPLPATGGGAGAALGVLAAAAMLVLASRRPLRRPRGSQ